MLYGAAVKSAPTFTPSNWKRKSPTDILATDAVTVVLFDNVAFAVGEVTVTVAGLVVPLLPPVLLNVATSATLNARLYKRTSSMPPTQPPYCPPKYRATYNGAFVLPGAVKVSLPTKLPSTYSRPVAPSYVAVTKCHPLLTVPPSAHPYEAPHVPVPPAPPVTMNLYFPPLASTPK